MELWHYLLLAVLGVIAGTFNVLAGGGSLLTLPAMVFLGLDGAVANGTNRVAILAQNVTAVGGFRSLGFSDMKLSLSLALAAFPGGICGALLGTMVRGELFNRVLGLDLVRVNMHKVFIVGFFTLAALVIFAARGQVLWIPGLALAVGNSIGGWIGSQLSVLKGENWIRTALYVALFLMAIRLLWPT
jgi:uncharacterized membrane protein YfcA